MPKRKYAHRKKGDTCYILPSEILVCTKSRHEYYFMLVIILVNQCWYRALKKEKKFITFSSVLQEAADDIKRLSHSLPQKQDYPLTPWK